MENIMEPSTTYTPDENQIIHTVNASLDGRGVPDIVHVVQYDDKLPILGVELSLNAQPYTVPEGAAVNVRMKKPDGTCVYNPSLGLSNDRHTVYIGITQQMTAAAGRAVAIVEIVLDGVVGSAPVEFAIDKNPVPENAIESKDEFLRLDELVAEAAESAQKAAQSESNAQKSETAAKSSQTSAENSATAALGSANAAAKSETNASTSENTAKDMATKAESYAVGDTETRPQEEIDNAKYYYEQAKRISQGLSGVLLPMGTIPFAELKNQNQQTGYMYNISDAFTTDSTFREGSGYAYPAGTNVYWTADENWDCLAGPMVTSVNGQTGDVQVQDVITGTQGQAVGFDSNGNAVAVNVGGTNLYSSTYNKRFNVSNAGNVETTNFSLSTDYLPCENAMSITAQAWGQTIRLNSHGEGLYLYTAYFTADKTFIKKESKSVNRTTDSVEHIILTTSTPSNAKYFIAGISVQYEDQLSDVRLKVERGSIATDWSPAPEDMLEKTEIIGGTNLLTGSKDFSGGNWKPIDTFQIDEQKYRGLTVLRKSTQWLGILQPVEMKANQIYCYSIYAKFEGDSTGVTTRFWSDGNAFGENKVVTLTKEWKRYSFLIQHDKDIAVNDNQNFFPHLEIAILGTSEFTMFICGAKLEIGSVATDWSPAPEDKQDLITGTAGQAVGFDSDGKAAAVEVGGTNLHIASRLQPEFQNGSADLLPPSPVCNEKIGDWISVAPGEIYTIQNWITTIANAPGKMKYWLNCVWFKADKTYLSQNNFIERYSEDSNAEEKQHVIKTLVVPVQAAYLRISARYYNDGKIKLERGTVATDWSPAPEDIPVVNKWNITVAASDWAATSETWAGMAVTQKAEKSCDEMTADTDITGIIFTGGNRYAASVWFYMRPEAGKVVLFSTEKPTEQFSLELTEMK